MRDANPEGLSTRHAKDRRMNPSTVLRARDEARETKKGQFLKSGKFFAYIVECKDGTYYTGSTNDLGKRVDAHNHSKRGAKYTRARRPVSLVWSKQYPRFKTAINAEIMIKRLGRKQKESLVKGELKIA